MKKKDGFFTGVEGNQIFYQHFEREEGRPGPTVLFFHGLGEHSGRYHRLGELVAEVGWNFVAVDHRGHGRSSGRRGHVMRFTHYLEDAVQLIEILSLYRPLIMGHSMGGLLATRFVQTYPQHARGLVLSAPLLGVAVPVPGWKSFLGKMMSRLIPSLSLPTGIDPNLLSHDEAEVEAYEKDPLISHVASSRWFTEMTSHLESAWEEVGKIEVPFLMQLAGDDAICNSKAAEEFFEKVSGDDKTLKIYPKFYHEIYNEKERDKVEGDLREWLEAREDLKKGSGAVASGQ